MWKASRAKQGASNTFPGAIRAEALSNGIATLQPTTGNCAMEGSAQSRRAMTSPRNMHLEKRYLEETFDLPSESACSFDSEPLQTLSPASGKDGWRGQAKGRDIGDGTTNCLASTAAASDCSPVRMSSTLDTLDIEKSRKEQPAADVRQAALNFSTALQSAPARQFPALWTLPQEKPEAGFGVKAECLVQEQAAFVRKALKKQLEDQGRVWLKEAQNLSHDVQQLRAQLAQTMEAALWSGKEVAAVRKDLGHSWINTNGTIDDRKAEMNIIFFATLLRLRFPTAASAFAAQFQMAALFGGPKPKRDTVIGNMETQINSVCQRHNPNYKALFVSWNDNQRQQGSCWGSNITDARLKGKDGEDFLVVRSQNFNERIGRVRAADVALLVGEGTSLEPITLACGNSI
eukprot:s79_g34.t1